jgi:cobyrinic acid a,c-diamide synthase
MVFDSYGIPLEIKKKIKHGFKTLAECGGILGVDDTSSLSFSLLILLSD